MRVIGDEFQSLRGTDASTYSGWLCAVGYQRELRLDAALGEVLRASIRAMFLSANDTCEAYTYQFNMLLNTPGVDVSARSSRVVRSHLSSIQRLCTWVGDHGISPASCMRSLQQDQDLNAVEHVADTQSLCSDAFTRHDLWRLSLLSLACVRSAAVGKFEESADSLQSAMMAMLCSQVDRALGNLYLQLGSISSAEHAYSSGLKWLHVTKELLAGLLRNEVGQHIGTVEGVLVDISVGMLYQHLIDFASNSHGVLKCIEHHADLQTDAESSTPFVSVSKSFVVDATNNIALGALNHCHVDKAVAMLEAALKMDPSTYMSDAVVFNLSTLYDLCFDSTKSNAYKQALQVLSETRPC